MKHKIVKSLKDPVGVVKRTLQAFLDKYKYQTPHGYDSEGYWSHRLGKYGFDLRGVGRYGLSHKENLRNYAKSKEIFLSLCRNERINFKSTKMLDIGCGTGFYAQIFLENGGKKYVGIDITDTLFGKLREMFPSFEFLKRDVTTEGFQGMFDLIIMIDVTQHITDNAKFSVAMQTVKEHLSENGVFIVSSWLDEKARKLYYEVSRPMDAYKREFTGFVFSEPIPFNNKFIFSIRRKRLDRTT